MGARRLTSAGLALALLIALGFVAVMMPSRPGNPAGSPRPVQQTGTAAGMPHRVPAAVTIGRVVKGRVVPATGSAASLFTGPVTSGAALLPGSVPLALTRKALHFPARGRVSPERVSPLAATAPPHKAGYVPTTSRKLPAASSTQIVYANADGTRTAFDYTQPVNYRTRSGTWEPISTTLVPDVPARNPRAVAGATSQASPSAMVTLPHGPAGASASPSPVPSPSPLVSPAAAAGGASAASLAPADGWKEQSAADPQSFAATAGAASLVTIPLDGSHAVSFGIAGAAPAPGAASGSTVAYAGVLPGATARFTAGAGLVKEALVLASPSAPATWVFPLHLTGLTARLGPGGSVEFTDASGRALAYVPHGFMTDSNIDPHSGDGATSYGVTYSVATVGGQQAITMRLNTTWLHSKERVYPVTVDPSVMAVNADGTTYVQSPGSADNSGGPEIHAGTFDGGANQAISFLNFGSVATKLSHDNVLGVRLGLFNTWSYSCAPRPVYVYPVTSAWTAGTAMSYPGPSIGRAVGEKSFAHGWVPLGSTASPCPASWEGINLGQAGTDLVNGWTHGAADNGLAVSASGSDTFGWKKFASSNGSSGSPFLAVTYTTDGASYQLASRRPVTQVTPSQAGSFAVRVTNTGASTWDASNANGYELSYQAFNARGQVVANHPVFTPLASTVGPGGSATVNVAVNALSAGFYRIIFSMYSGTNGSSPQSFASQGIQDYEIALYVPEPPPVIASVYPPTGFIASTLQQQLATSATAAGTVTYDFTMTCEPLPGQACSDTSPVTSGTISKPYWTPPASDLQWNTPYQWQVTVTGCSGGVKNSKTISGIAITAQPPQPVITSTLGGSTGNSYDPVSGNYTTSATDAAVRSVGPALQIDRVYNSLDPRTTGAFGAGWSSVLDTSLRNDGATVTVTLPTGQEITFGKNGDGTYAPPFGSHDVLVQLSTGTWSLGDSSGDDFVFTPAGALSSFTDQIGRTQAFSPAGQPTSMEDVASGRTLTIGWTGSRVTSVTTPGPQPGQQGFTWTYTYAGSKLTQVCAPAAVGTGCTAYSYGSGSNYRASVLDAGPRSSWQLGEASGTTAADDVDVNLGTTDGAYHNATLGAAGPLAGSSETAAAFNGSSSYVTLPGNLVTDGTSEAVGLWFKTASTTASGILFSADAKAVTDSTGATAQHEPVLYVGTNGELYGELWTGSVEPIHTSASVADGKWHYAVLSASGSSQTLYLDGAPVGTLNAQVDNLAESVDTVGSGFWGGWTSSTSSSTGYFNGDIGQVAFYPQPLSAGTIEAQYALGSAASPGITAVTLPSGNVHESVTYDPATDRVASYTDPNGGRWTVGQPLTTGQKASSDSLGQVIEYVTVTNPAGRQETYGYDMLNGSRLVSFNNGVDPTEVYGYDAAGFLATAADQDGNLACFTNDVHGNVLARTWYPIEPASLPGGGVGTATACGGATSSSATCTTTGAPCTTFYSYTPYDTAKPLDPRNNKLVAVRDGRSGTATDTTFLTAYGYNSNGQLSSSTTPVTIDFPAGRTTSYTYSTGTEAGFAGGNIPVGLLLTSKTPGGAVTSYSYYSNGDLAQVTEPSGRRTVYTYDGLGRALTSTVFTSTAPSAGEKTTYTYDSLGNQQTVLFPAVTNAVTGVTHQLLDTYAYDPDGNPVTLTQSDAGGSAQPDPSRTTTYTYNDHDEVSAVTQPVGATTGGTAQADGAPSASPQGATTGYSYDGYGSITQVTDPNGNQFRYSYNEYREPTQETLYTASANEASSTATCTSPAVQDPDGGCDLVLSSDAYDPAGLLAAKTDAMGRITNYTYDHNQDLVAVAQTQPCSTATPCTSTAPCTPTAACTTGTVGQQTADTYDGAGHLVSQAVSATRSGGVKTTTTTTFAIDPAGRLTSTVADAPPSGTPTAGFADRTTAYTYDADGHVLSATTGTGSALAVTGYGYDTAGDLTSQTVQDGSASNETTWTYDQNGHPLTQTSPLGNVSGATAASFTTTYSYDPATGNLVTKVGPPVPAQSYAAQSPAMVQPVTTLGYDTFGDQTQAQDPDGNTTVTGYDGDGRVASVTRPSYTPPGAPAPVSGTTTYAYDEAGNVASVTGPNPAAADQSPTVTTSYGYDALRDLTSVTEPQLAGQSAPGTWQYTYDADGEQLSAKSPAGNLTSSTYDNFGRQATSTDALGHTTQFAYDYLGDQTLADTPDGSVTTAAFDHLGEPTSTTDAVGNTSALSYDDQGRVAAATAPDGSSEQYGYDEAGNLTSVSDFGPVPASGPAPLLRSASFGYNANSEQVSATDFNGNTATFGYDAAGDLTSQVHPITATTSATTSFGYDPAGNQTAVTSGNGNTTWTTYNPWNLPESVIKPPPPRGRRRRPGPGPPATTRLA
jgi:YD repeat-containing protein